MSILESVPGEQAVTCCGLATSPVTEADAARLAPVFKALGDPVRLRMVEKEPFKLVKVTGEDGSPMDFTFWLQLVSADVSDTRMRLVLHVKLNMMMKMMIGGKLQQALDQIADQIAEAFNNAPV